MAWRAVGVALLVRRGRLVDLGLGRLGLGVGRGRLGLGLDGLDGVHGGGRLRCLLFLPPTNDEHKVEHQDLAVARSVAASGRAIRRPYGVVARQWMQRATKTYVLERSPSMSNWLGRDKNTPGYEIKPMPTDFISAAQAQRKKNRLKPLSEKGLWELWVKQPGAHE